MRINTALLRRVIPKLSWQGMKSLKKRAASLQKGFSVSDLGVRVWNLGAYMEFHVIQTLGPNPIIIYRLIGFQGTFKPYLRHKPKFAWHHAGGRHKQYLGIFHLQSPVIHFFLFFGGGHLITAEHQDEGYPILGITGEP